MERTAGPSASLGMTKGRATHALTPVEVDGENCRSLHGTPGQVGFPPTARAGLTRLTEARIKDCTRHCHLPTFASRLIGRGWHPRKRILAASAKSYNKQIESKGLQEVAP
jgi:hypothetical protein